MKRILSIAGIVIGCFSMPVFADGFAIAKEAGCLSCHAVDRKVVGPSFKDVAERYKDVDDAEYRLIMKVKVGSSGIWGKARMPANLSKMTDAEYKTAISWILSLK